MKSKLVKENLNEDFSDDAVRDSQERAAKKEKRWGGWNSKEEITPADKGFEAARKDNRSKGDMISDAFESAVGAMNRLNEISIRDFDDDVYQQVSSAETEVEKLMDLLDSKLRK